MPFLKILVVEDYVPFRRVICSSLRQRAEFQVIESADGLDAVEKAKELQPDLVLLDIGLPKLNGIESARQVRALVPHAKVMFLSQESSPDVVREAFRLGAQGYVHKQRLLSDLLPAIEEVLGGKLFVSRNLEFNEGTDAQPGNEKLIHIADAADLKKTEELQWYYAAIVDFSDDAIISKDLEGIISSWNSAAHRIFGYTEEEAIGQSITIIIPPDLRAEEEEILRRLRAFQHVSHYETRRVSKDGRTIDVSISVSPVQDAEGRIIGASKIARDISERKRADAALRESEERFRLVANTAPVMIWMSGVDKLRTYFNRRWLDFTGRPINAEIGNGWAEGVHLEDVKQCLETYTKAFDRREPFKMEYRLRRHDGEYRWLFASGVPRFNTDGSFAGYVGSAIDVTERKLAEAFLSTMNQRLIEAHEEERTRIARELHDDISQRLALLAITLQGLDQRLPASAAELVREMGEARKQVVDLGNDIQALSHRLHSPRLELLGLTKATIAFCKELSERQGVKIDFYADNLPPKLPREVSLCLFRILQEALQNAIKHSRSHHFRVSLTNRANDLELAVHDSGCGFEPEQAINGSGIGLTSMRERLKLVNGELSIDSHLGTGTTIRARVPLSLRKKARRAGK